LIYKQTIISKKKNFFYVLNGTYKIKHISLCVKKNYVERIVVSFETKKNDAAYDIIFAWVLILISIILTL